MAEEVEGTVEETVAMMLVKSQQENVRGSPHRLGMVPCILKLQKEDGGKKI